jgi:hypothetical protein
LAAETRKEDESLTPPNAHGFSECREREAETVAAVHKMRWGEEGERE